METTAADGDPLGITQEQLQAARAGSAAALGQILSAMHDELLRLAQGGIAPGLRAKEGASDLVQQTFLEAHRDIGQFAGSTVEELRGWLRTILGHNLLNFSRRYRDAEKRRVDREIALATADAETKERLVLATPSPSNKAISREQAAALAEALARLPEDYRQAIQLREQEKQSFAEIGAAMARSAEAARKLWARAIQRLKQELGGGP